MSATISLSRTSECTAAAAAVRQPPEDARGLEWFAHLPAAPETRKVLLGEVRALRISAARLRERRFPNWSVTLMIVCRATLHIVPRLWSGLLRVVGALLPVAQLARAAHALWLDWHLRAAKAASVALEAPEALHPPPRAEGMEGLRLPVRDLNP